MKARMVVKVLELAATWVPTLLLVLVFGTQGAAKLPDAGPWTEAFRHWGLPDWFRIAIGLLELTAAALLLRARTAVYGALIIAAVMVGAMGTRFFSDGTTSLSSELLALALSVIVILTRRRHPAVAESKADPAGGAMKRSLLALGFVVLAGPTRAVAQETWPASLDRYVRDAVQEIDLPGAAVAVVAGGRTIAVRGYGVRERPSPRCFPGRSSGAGRRS